MKNTIFNTAGTLVYFAAQWLTTVLAVRLANFETAGIYALAISFTNIFYYIALFGIRNFHISDAENQFSEGQYIAAHLAAAAGATAAFLIGVFLSRLSAYTLVCYLVYMGFKLGETFTNVYFSILQRQRRYRELAASYVAKALLPTGMFVTALAWTQDLLTSIIAMTAGYGVVVLTMDRPKLTRIKGVCPEFRGCGKILRLCVPLLLISLSLPVMNYVTRHAVEQVMDRYSVGQYASLSSVIVVLSTLAGSAFLVFIPEVSEWKLYDEWCKVEKLFLSVLLGMLATGGTAVLIGRLLGPTVCALIFGPDILENIDLLIPLIITATALMIKSFFSAMLVPLKKRGTLLLGECCGCLLCAVSALPLTRRLGMQGANLSYLIGVTLQCLILGGCCFGTVCYEKSRLNNTISINN